MLAALVAATAAALLAGTGVTVASSLGLADWPRVLLAAYVLAFAEVVALVWLFSAFGILRRPALLIGAAALAAAAVVPWWRRGRPLPHVPRLRLLVRSGPLAALAIVVFLTLAYVVALAVGTPPNTWDSLVYHLVRAAIWRQEGAAGYVENAYEERIDANPPNAEIALAFVLELTRDEHVAPFVQLASALACAVGVYALSRRLGLTAAEAAFGGLLLLTLPIVALQASTTQNDLVVAALLVAATVFLLEDRRAPLGLAGVATALAVGAKLTALFALPVLALVALVASPRRARLLRLAALALGAAAGSYWYLVNVAKTGELLGERPDTDLIVIGDLRENLLAGFARVLDAFDLSGAEGTHRFVVPDLASSDIAVYVLTAAVLAGGLLGASLLTGRPRIGIPLLAGGLALVPLTVNLLAYPLWRLFAKLHDVLGSDTEALPAGEPPSQTVASESLSWFGPLGPFVVAGALVAAVVLYRRRVFPRIAIVLGAAPLVWLVLLSLVLRYDVWQGRFFVYPVALSGALWGLVLRYPPAAWATVTIGATTVGLSFVNYLEKPSGVELFADGKTKSVWHMDRAETQSLPRPEMAPVFRFVESRVAADSSIALALRGDDFGYPYFGPRLGRHVDLVAADDGALATGATWLVASPSHAPLVDPACWRAEHETPQGWTVFRAAMGDRSC